MSVLMLQLIFSILILIGIAVMGFTNLRWMRTLTKWQQLQDEEICRIVKTLEL